MSGFQAGARAFGTEIEDCVLLSYDDCPKIHTAWPERILRPGRLYFTSTRILSYQLIGRLLAFNTSERVLSIGRVTADGATNVVPDEVRMEGTLRTFDETLRSDTYDAIHRTAAETDTRYGTTTTVDISRGYPCVVNDPTLTRLGRQLAGEFGRTVELPLRTTAEDFGFYTHRYPALFYRLGVGPDAGKTHTSTFSPDERAITTGIAFMKALALKLLNEK